MTYDLIILGAGAAGLTASIYSSRYKVKHLVFGEKPGGQIADAHLIENYPGFKSIAGSELTDKFFEHAKGYGVEIIGEAIGQLRKIEGGAETGYEVGTKLGKAYQAKALILAMGARHRSLNIPGEEAFLGRGLSYCATCDAPLYKGKTVAVVGGGDSALTAAILLADYAVRVYLIHRGDAFRGEPVWVEQMRAKSNVVEILGNEIVQIIGKAGGGGQNPKGFGGRSVGAVELKKAYKSDKTLTVDGVFVEVGLIPAASLVNALGVVVTSDGYVQITPDGRTNVDGIFAAGDLCRIPGSLVLRQIVTSAAQGALAAASAYQYLNKQGPNPSWG